METTCSSRFHDQLKEALASVTRILDLTRSPRCAKEEDHSYEDKYEMAVLLTNTSIAAIMNAMERLDMTQAHLKEMMELVHVQKSTLTLRFDLQYTCVHLSQGNSRESRLAGLEDYSIQKESLVEVCQQR
jgi:hypothetical protein